MTVTNLVMKEMVDSNEAIDLSSYEREGKYYVLDTFIDGMDYCNLETEQWIWSIGLRKTDGKILASHTTDMDRLRGYKCLFLR